MKSSLNRSTTMTCRKHGHDVPDREDFVKWPSAVDDRTLGVVDFSIFPHLNAFPTNTSSDAERWAADIGGPAYAIDEQTAIKVVDGSVEVISEGQWTKFG
jgi:dipeptidase E